MKHFSLLILIIISFYKPLFSQKNTFQKKLFPIPLPVLAISPNGNILISGKDHVVSLDSLGRQLWFFPLLREDHEIEESHAITLKDGSTVVFVTIINTYKVFKLDKEGKQVWYRKFVNVNNPRSSNSAIYNYNDKVMLVKEGVLFAISTNGDSLFNKPVPELVSNERVIQTHLVNDTLLFFTSLNSMKSSVLRFDLDLKFISRITFNDIIGLHKVAKTVENDFILVSAQIKDSKSYSTVYRVNKGGGLISTHPIALKYVSDLVATTDGGFICVESSYPDVILHKYDNSGKFINTEKQNGFYASYYKGIKAWPGGGAIVIAEIVGTDPSFGNGGVTFVLKTDNYGTIGGADFSYVPTNMNSYMPVAIPKSVGWADVEEDGFTDVLVNGRLYENTAEGYKIKEPNDFVTKNHNYNYYPSGISSYTDVNNSSLDIYQSGGYNKDEIFVNRGDNSFFYDSTAFPSNGNPSSLETTSIDYDNDGYLDIFNANSRYSDSLTFELFKNQGNRKFKKVNVIDFPNGEYPYGSAWIDIDQD
ncbi:MAG TPA: VCBS repeat-containing protein, partial [Cytophagaceae bacterium]